MRIVIVGAGGHGTVVADILLRMREAGAAIEPVAFVDDEPPADRTQILSLPVLPGGIRTLASLGHDAAIVAIGDNATRRRIAETLRRAGTKLACAQHPSSIVSPDAHIEEGAMICAGAAVAPGSRIGLGTIVNTLASVDHHTRVGDYAHIAPGVHLGGDVCIGDGTLVGIGASVRPGRRVGRRVVIGAGAVVVSDVPDEVVTLGVPARVHHAAARPRPFTRDEVLMSTETAVRRTAATYFPQLERMLRELDLDAVGRVFECLQETRDAGGTIYLAGNGGSAATASHWANDLGKAARLPGAKPIRVIPLGDHISWLTALANDEGYDRVFAGQLENFAGPGDVLLVFSASGNSPNLVQAVLTAKSRGARTLALLGFDGGALKGLVDDCVWLPTPTGAYGQVEDAHLIVCHLLTTCLAGAAAVVPGISRVSGRDAVVG